MLAGLSLLLLLPFVVYRLAKRAHSSRTWTLTGLSFGLVISPASLGLYILYIVPYVGLVPGIIGLVSSLIHGAPGFEAATALGLRGTHVVNAQEAVTIDVINGLFWGIVYGALGHVKDFLDR
ncbi:MAG: hypothetical protein ACRD33_10760 [Candidatus Acidiferrales bacterium]